ncbi:MAG: class I SAM-dependent methyltransferase [Bacteroidia bacterium]
MPFIDYVPCDKFEKGYTYPPKTLHADITDIPFETDSMDYIICSHVLEHVQNDKKAIGELYRVLKPGGQLFLQVPLDKNLASTHEDDLVVSNEDREKFFWQWDHVRLYGNDFIERAGNSGFKTEQVSAKSFLSEAEVADYKCNGDIYVCFKPVNDSLPSQPEVSQKLKEKLLDTSSFESVDLKLNKYNAQVDIRNQSKIEIAGAERYTYVDDLWILSSYYNPEKYKTKRYNYETFVEKINKSNLNYRIIECAFGRDPFELPASKNVIQIRARDVMWQKERLLNHAIKLLPASCTKVAWVDCDILFENPEWAVDTSVALDHYKVVQPFEFAVRLPKDVLSFKGIGDLYSGFGYIYKNYPNILTTGNFANHGHTGFAWAAQRSILEKYGLYDVCIGGTADHVMAHAFCGDWDTGCINRFIGANKNFYNHYLDWCKSMYKEVKGKVSYVQGTILHLWHGEIANRMYAERERNLEVLKYNPYKDLKKSKNGPWEWNTRNKELKEFTRNYFAYRKEDG